MGLFSKDDLNLSAIRTEDMSSEIPYLKHINSGADSLISRLNVANKNLVLFSESENYNMYNMFQKSNNISNDNFSETSPFISSDVYNHLVQNKNMTGGAESSSSTSSSTQTDGSSEKKKDKKKHKKSEERSENKSEEKSQDKSEEKSSSEEDEEFMGRGGSESNTVSESENSYVSSSAHTDGVMSESEDVSTVSISRKHRGRKNYSESVNTSDINIISVDE